MLEVTDDWSRPLPPTLPALTYIASPQDTLGVMLPALPFTVAYRPATRAWIGTSTELDLVVPDDFPAAWLVDTSAEHSRSLEPFGRAGATNTSESETAVGL